MFESANTITKLFLLCPFCGVGEQSVGQLPIGRPFGPWFCEECGCSFRGVRTQEGASIEKLATVTAKIPAVLQYKHDPRLRLIVTAPVYSDYKDLDHRHYYGEHTCPTNVLRATTEVLLQEPWGEDRDPHGVFEFLRYATPEDLGEEAEETEDGIVSIPNT